MRKIIENIPKKIKHIIRNLVSKADLQLPPVRARGCQHSMIFSSDDDNAQPSEYLISLGLKAIQHAQKVSLTDISARMKKTPYWPDIWPGEHYRLLAGLVLELKPKLVIEIGTGAGLSALTMKKYLSQESKIVTFDIVGRNECSYSCLKDKDFSDNRLIQHTDNLAQHSAISKHIQLLQEADMIFIDGPKDGVTENKIWNNFKTVPFKNKPLLVFDDIRLWNMLRFWRDISLPKLDLTSFGHWSGTGIVELK